MYAALALLALIIEAVAGYPDALLRRIGHPVEWIGALITHAERAWNLASLPFERRRLNGVLALAVVLLVTLSITVLLVAVLDLLPWILPLLLTAFLASTLLAQRSLDVHVKAVADALEAHGIDAGRVEVAKIVGRDPETLDPSAVARAAIESLAENFSDGVVAPVFWMVVGGLPGAAVYKAVNTADSMIGHKSDRHLAFGWAAARLDDLINLPASRLTALFFVGAAYLIPDASWESAVESVKRDASKHRSPNAGWPEAAMAGALGLKLAGPRIYGGKTVDDHWMGNGRANATPADIRRALQLYRVACALQAALVAAVALVVWVV
jgi:adenosylcobinamide-phosphate synthase